MTGETATVPAAEDKMEETPAPSTSVEQTDGEDVDAKAKLLMGEGHKNLVLKNVRCAVNAFQEASSLLGKKYGETADECADAFYYYGMALLDLARMENNVLGNALEGMPEEEDEESEKDPNIPSAANLDEKERDQLREQVYEAMAEDEKSEKQNGKEPKAEDSKDDEMECEKSSEAEETKEKSSEAETKDEKSSEAKETKDEKSSEAKETKDEKSSEAETKEEKSSEAKKSSETETKEKPSEAEEVKEKPCDKSSEAEVKEKSSEAKKSSEAEELKEKPCEKSAEAEVKEKSSEAKETTKSEGENAKAEKSTEAEAKPESTSEAAHKENGTTEATGEEKSKTEEAPEKSKTEVEADSTQEPEEKPKEAKDTEDAAKSEEEEAEPMEGEEEEGEESDDNNEETDEKENDEDEVGNLQLAWEMLDLSKVIFKRQQGKEEQLKAAQAHLKLGEVSIESENYTQAVEDFLSCLNIQKEHLEKHDRLLAETHYQLGLAYQYSSKHEEAISHFTQSIDVIEKRLVVLTEQLEKAAEETKEETQKEMEELKGLLPDIKEKIEDSKEAQKTAEDTSKALKETLGGTSSTGFPQENGGTSTSTATAEKSSGDSTVPVTNCVSDISHLVRKKRKPEEDSPLKDAKKPKSEPVANGSGNGDAVVPTNEQVEKTEEAENQTPMETATVESTA